MSDELYQLLGLVRRSGQVISGSTLMEHIRARKVSLVLYAEDASKRTIKQINDKCLYYGIACFQVGSSDQLSSAVGLSNRMAIGISDRGFAQKVVSMLKNEGGSKYEE